MQYISCNLPFQNNFADVIIHHEIIMNPPKKKNRTTHVAIVTSTQELLGLVLFSHHPPADFHCFPGIPRIPNSPVEAEASSFKSTTTLARSSIICFTWHHPMAGIIQQLGSHEKFNENHRRSKLIKVDQRYPKVAVLKRLNFSCRDFCSKN